jgi:PAS domain-containing protein
MVERESDTLESKLNWAQQSQALAVRILTLLNRQIVASDVIREIVGLVKEYTGFEAVQIRLRDREDFPYFETRGFPSYFVEVERSLCTVTKGGEIVRDPAGNPVLECMCGNILQGRTDPSLPFFTPGGSFWTNSTTELLATTTEKERQTRPRDRCNSEGYESVALVPLRSEPEIIGLLQLNDSRRNRFTPEMIDFFEGIGVSIGIVLERKRIEEERDRLFNLSIDMLRVAGFHHAAALKTVNEALFRETLELKRAEEALKLEREQLLSIFDSINEVILVIDSRTHEILYTNRFTKDLYGKELVGGQCFKELGDRDSPCGHCIGETVTKLEGRPHRWEYHNSKVHRDYLATDRIIKWTDGREVKFQFAIDITERKRAEQDKENLRYQLLHAQKMEAIGTLAWHR